MQLLVILCDVKGRGQVLVLIVLTFRRGEAKTARDVLPAGVTPLSDPDCRALLYHPVPDAGRHSL